MALKCKALVMCDINPYQSPATPVSPMESLPDVDSRLYEAAQTLAQTRPWVRFLSVLAFLLFGFTILGMAGMAAFMNTAGPDAFAMTTIATMILMYFVPAILMWKYANRISWFLNEQTPATLAEAISAQKTFWNYVGVAGMIGVVYTIGASFVSVLT
jgi:hypothetical protein